MRSEECPNESETPCDRRAYTRTKQFLYLEEASQEALSIA